MSDARIAEAHCGADGHCVTCSDEGVPMVVARLEGSDTAVCHGDGGAPEEVAIDLVGAAAPGDVLLVHAGVAIARLTEEAA